MNRIADRIAADCGGRLDAVVATHRHQDHVSGFTRSGGSGPGEVIRNLRPKVVVQPWTEDPKAAVDATRPTRSLHVRTLRSMHAVAAQLVDTADGLRGPRFAEARARLRAIGLDNIKNRDAVENLATMAPNRFVYFGRSPRLGSILPGVTVSVLGPPTVEQTSSILQQRREDPDEFWHLRAAFWQRQALGAERNAGKAPRIFPRHPTGPVPRSAGWFKWVVMHEWAESLLGIVRTLDDAMNNTSVILLFEVNGRSVLFPGDAQYENWMYALGKQSVLDKLKGVDLYKVGHHGSLNATPRTLWNGFTRRGSASKARRLRTVLSTKSEVHGHEDKNTEVPRESLVNALTRDSALTNTQKFAPDELSRAVTLSLS
jgi:hypothetical protein